MGILDITQIQQLRIFKKYAHSNKMRRTFALNLKCIVSSPGDVLTLACVSRGGGVIACVSRNLTFCPITHTTLPGKRAKKCDYVLVFEAKRPKFKGAHPRTICHRLGPPTGPKILTIEPDSKLRTFYD